MIQHSILFNNLKEKGYKFDEKSIINDSKMFRKNVEEILLEDNIIKDDELAKIKGEILNLPVKIFEKNETIEKEVLDIVEESSARNYKLAVFDKKEKELFVMMLNPDNEKAFEAISFIAKQRQLQLKVFVTTSESLQRS
jgi:hypothetical protein